MLERGDERVLHALLGQIEVSEAPHERRGQPARFLPEDGRDRVARDGRRRLVLHDRPDLEPEPFGQEHDHSLGDRDRLVEIRGLHHPEAPDVLL